MTLTSELAQQNRLETVGGDAYISQLISAVPSAISVEAYGRLVEQTAVRRRLLDVASDIARFAYDESIPVEQVVDHSEKALFGVSQKRLSQGLKYPRVCARYYDQSRRCKLPRRAQGRAIGLSCPVQHTRGFLSQICLSCGTPGCKTSLMLTFALPRRGAAKILAQFSLEMSAEHGPALVSPVSGIDAQRLRLVSSNR